MIKNILVVGATGRTGQIIVSKLIQQGFETHVLVRDIPAAQLLLGSGLTYHLGDVRNFDSVLTAMTNMDAVISAVGTQTPVGKNCPKRVDYEGVANLVKAACMQEIKRFILISSIAVTRPSHPMNCFGRILDWKRKGEETLRESGLDHAIIRPGGLKDTPGGIKDLIFDQGDTISGTISRADVAETCLNALQYPQRLCTTFEVIEADHKASLDWSVLFSSLLQDC
jgi:uncharacterized protein YbjT (DUF2867 family)